MIKRFFIISIVLATVVSGLNFRRKTILPFAMRYPNKWEQTTFVHSDKYEYSAYKSGEDILQVKQYKSTDKTKAKKIIFDRVFFLNSMFTDQPTPYPGVLSQEIGCPPDMVPTINTDTVNMRMQCNLFATPTLVYGNCSPADNQYQSLYVIFHCEKSKEAFEIKFFTPLAKPSVQVDALAASIHCK